MPTRDDYRKFDEKMRKLGAPRMVTPPDEEEALAKQAKMRQTFERKAKSRIRRVLRKARRRGISPRECTRRSLQIYASLRPFGLTNERIET